MRKAEKRKRKKPDEAKVRLEAKLAELELEMLDTCMDLSKRRKTDYIR